MPEITTGYFELPNPNWDVSQFADTYRTTDISAADGVKARWSPLLTNGNWKVRLLLFDQARWANIEVCQAWVRQHRQELKSMPLENMRVKSVQIAAADGVPLGPRPTATDLEMINELALEPLTADGVYVRRMALANDQIDRDFERFSRGVLKQFSDTLPGKSVLIGHDHSSAPIGRFYKAEALRAVDGVVNLVGSWYAPVTDENAHDRASIDSGVWSNVSIGFRWDTLVCDLCGTDYRDPACPHILGQQYPVDGVVGQDLATLVMTEDGNSVTATATYRGKAEALEGSVVYLGAQFGAEMVKAKMIGDMREYKRLVLADADKGVVPFQDLPAAPETLPWSWSAEDQNAVLGDPPNWARYRSAHLWYDESKPEVKVSYKLPIAHRVNSRLVVLWSGLHHALGRLSQAQIPDADKTAIRAQIEKYYKKFDKPFPKGYDPEHAEAFVLADGEGDGIDAPGAGQSMEPASGNSTAGAGDTMNDDEKQAAEAAVKAAEDRAAEAETAKTALEARAKALRAPVVADVKRIAGLIGRESEFDALAGALGEDLELLTDEKLLGLRDAWQKVADDAAPPGRQSTPGDLDGPAGPVPADRRQSPLMP